MTPKERNRMSETLEALERKRKVLQQQLALVGDFHRGTVSASYRKCGKKNCACAKSTHRGHLRYQWTTTTKGNRSRARNLRLGAELEKASREAANYHEFLRLIRELVEVNEKICELRPVRDIKDEDELEGMKKKQRKQFAAKQRKS